MVEWRDTDLPLGANVPLDENAHCTVCIPTYNQSRYLREAVESVARQTAPVRLLVSNDASPDDTAEVIAELQSRYAFQAMNHPANLGISANLQWMLRQPQTPFIMRLDSDDFLHPDYIEVLLELLARYPQAGYAHCAIQEVDADSHKLQQRRLARSKEFQDAEVALRRAINGYQVAANLLIFRREALAAVDFGAGSAALNFVEDYDLSIRLADAGWGNVYSGRVLASYRTWSGSSRPVVGRKLREVQGLAAIFSGSLLSAFRRRNWPLDILQRRRAELAMANAEVLDRAEFRPGEREQMIAALIALSDSKRVRRAVGQGMLASLLRRSVHLYGKASQAGKRWVKRLLFRR